MELFLARSVVALRSPREFLGTFTGCFLNFVSPRIMQEIRSIPTARLGGEVLRELSEAAVSTSDPLPLVASSILVGWRQPGRDKVFHFLGRFILNRKVSPKTA